MQLQIKGTPSGITQAIVGRVTRDIRKLDEHSIFILQDGLPVSSTVNNAMASITASASPHPEIKVPQIYGIPALDHLEDGDLLSLDNLGNVHTLYRVNSVHNSLLVTETCNSRCLMCSQPPKKKDDISHLFNIHRKLISLIPKDYPELTITGGEPTLLGDTLFELLKIIHTELPETDVHVLTNGRKFAWTEFASKLEEMDTERVVFGIPLYSDYYGLHDYIVQAESAFYQTMLGFHNLARLDQRTEIRVVLHKLTVERLDKLARYIYRNLPFAEHVAFMGLENTGFTPHNSNLLWIDPYDYREQLRDAAMYLHSFGMNVSIYNDQLCTLPKELWRFARKSISEWKNIYLQQCGICEVKSQCGGFFQSCGDVHSRHIKPVLSNMQTTL